MCLGCLCVSSEAQQNIDASMVVIPTQNFGYTINKKKKSVTVSNFYISKFPESNKQYQDYLGQLSGMDRAKALPNKQLLEKSGLNKVEVDFLTNKYYSSKEFYLYPMIGLSNNQILKYLDWKTEYIGKMALKSTGIKFDTTMNYIDIIKKQKDIGFIPVQTDFLIPSDAQLISAFKYFSNKKSNSRKRSPDVKPSGVLKDLKLKSIYCLNVETNKSVDELIFTLGEGSTLTKNGKDHTVYYPENGKTVRITGNVNKKLKCNYEKQAILQPFRVWHVKI